MTGTRRSSGATVPLVQEKIGLLSEFPGYAGFLFGEVEPDAAQLDGSADLLEAAAGALAAAEPFTAETIEAALRRVADERELKPREAFQPIRIAVTGSKVSPGPLREHRAARPRRVRARLSA